MKKSSSRTGNSLKNMIASLIGNFVVIIVGLISRKIFIRILGNEYNGLNGLFTNIISLLSIVELGIGNAIIYNLYKPIAKKEYEKIKSLMKFYRKSYHIIGVIVFILGISIIPFLHNFVGEVTIDINIKFIYMFFLLDTVFSYFLSYKRSILYANQKNYYINIVNILYVIIMNTLQLVFLFITKNFYIYLLIKVIMRVIENVAITIIADKKYPYLKEKNVQPIDKEVEKDIFKKVKALFLHQIGGFIINGTDNIIISRFLGLLTVGLYSNYYLIINSVQNVAKQIIQATTPSVGNMLVTESVSKQFDVFKKMRFLNFWIATFCAISIYVVMDTFIIIWIGKENLLSAVTLFVLTVNFYQKCSRYTYGTFKNAAGIFYEDRFVPIIESIVNIVISVVLVKTIGLPGVFIGTVLSGLVLWCFSYPKYVYKKIFNGSYINYFKETVGYILLFLLLLFITVMVSKLNMVNNGFLKLIINMIIAVVVPNVLLIVCFAKTDNFKYYWNMLKNFLSKFLNKLKGKKDVKI